MKLTGVRMIGGTRRQVAITSIAAFAVYYFRYTWLPGASPYESFLLLNILVAILFRPKALLLSAALGLVAAHLLIGLEGGPLFTGEYWKLTLAYLILSGLLLVFNRLGYKLSARVFREQRLKEEIVNSSLDAIVTLDAEGRFVTFNTAAMKLFGYARQEVTGQRMVDLIIPPEFRQAFEEAVTKATSSEPRPIGIAISKWVRSARTVRHSRSSSPRSRSSSPTARSSSCTSGTLPSGRRTSRSASDFWPRPRRPTA
jgi:PAS domain S-box-containing protein